MWSALSSPTHRGRAQQSPTSAWMCKHEMNTYLNGVVASSDTSILHFHVDRRMRKLAFGVRPSAFVALKLTTHFQLKPTRIFHVHKVVYHGHNFDNRKGSQFKERQTIVGVKKQKRNKRWRRWWWWIGKPLLKRDSEIRRKWTGKKPPQKLKDTAHQITLPPSSFNNNEQLGMLETTDQKQQQEQQLWLTAWFRRSE